MTAGLYICVVDELNEGQLASVLLGSGSTPFLDLRPEHLSEPSRPVADRLGDAPRVFLGEGPWGQDAPDAQLLPDPLARIEHTVGSGPIGVDDAYIAQILIPFDRRGETTYRLGRQGEIWRFLRQHQGKRALLTIRPDESGPVGETDASVDADTATPGEGESSAEGVSSGAATPNSDKARPEPAPEPEPRLPPMPTIARGLEATTVDGVRPLALVLVSSQPPPGLTTRERILAALATIGTFGASLAAAAGLNSLIR